MIKSLDESQKIGVIRTTNRYRCYCMKRDQSIFTNKIYDLLIVGGGIYGACIAWDATLRGLSVALVDKGDFGHATSANELNDLVSSFEGLPF